MKTLILGLIFTFSVIGATAQEATEYYMSKTVNQSFEETTVLVKDALKKQGFGVITEIEMDEKLKEKIPDADIKPYRILGVCNPGYAYETIKVEENIGLFLPCKVLIKQIDANNTEVVMVNPSVLMGMLGNDSLTDVAAKVTKRFKKALADI
ncbi:MAG: hypothetical protein C0595_08855 [Marinilabiliales bacterium]|nr:MAG: hypothetical protein C0595_08855 [Marinilabiliales bacterium]